MKTTSEQNQTVQNPKTRTETGQTNSNPPSTKTIKSLPKDHADYWGGRLKKRSYSSRQGAVVEVPEWQVRMFHAGKEDWFNLGTANKAAASVKARDIYVQLKNHGWDATLAKHKPKATEKLDVTIGDFLDQVKAVSGLKPVTFEIYGRKFRSLVAGAFKIDGGKAKHDYVNGGHKGWLDKVRNVRLEKLTSEMINDWKVQELKAASFNPLSLKRAQVTVRAGPAAITGLD